MYLFPGLFIIALFYDNMKSGWGAYENIYTFYFFISLILLGTAVSFLVTATQSEFSFNRVDLLLSILVVYYFLLVLIHRGPSFFDEKVITALYLFLLYLFFKIVFTASWFVVKIFPYVILILGLITSLHGLAQYLHLLPSPNPVFLVTGSFNNPGPFSGYLVCTIPFAIFAYKNGNKFFQVTALITFCAIAITLGITQSRSAVIAMSVLLVFFLQASFPIQKITRIKWLVPLLCFVLLTIAMVHLRSDSASGRVLIWNVSYEMFASSPFIGLGPGQFAIQYNNYQSEYFKRNPNDNLASLADNNYFAFNEGLQISVESGLLGALLSLAVLFFAFKDTEHSKFIPLIQVAKGTVLTVCIFGLFSYPLSSIAISTIFAACLAYLSTQSEKKRTIDVNSKASKIFMCVVIILICGITYRMFEKYRAIKRWKAAYALLTTDGDKKAFDDYKEVYSDLQDHGGFLFNYGAELSEAGFDRESVAILEKAKLKFNHVDLYIFLGNSYKRLKEFDKAEAAYLHAAYMIPNRLFTQYQLVQLYVEQNKMEQALTQAKRVVQMQPKVNSSTAVAIKQEMNTLLKEHQPL